MEAGQLVELVSDELRATARHDLRAKRYVTTERLGAPDARQAEIVELRYFGGLTVEEVARTLGVSKRTVEDEWTHAKGWLRAELAREKDP